MREIKTSRELSGIGMTSERTRERLVERLIEQGVQNISVLEVMRTTPRHIFIEEALAHRAYEDVALPIGFSQTISQPYIVARMTDLLLANDDVNKVLEIGTGSGFQTAVLARLCDQVFTAERILPLQARAKIKLEKIGINNVSFFHTDGEWGVPKYGPYDGILCTAAPEKVPEKLLAQLALNGRLIIPVGSQENQILTMITRLESKYQFDPIEPVRFVPLLQGLVSA